MGLVATPRVRRGSRKREPAPTQEAPTLLTRQSRISKPPPPSARVFVAEGYGAELIRRLMQNLGWKELPAKALSGPGSAPQLLWSGSVTGRKLFKDEVLQSWQLLNHFPRSGVIGSKSGLLWSLRDHCGSQNAEGSKLMAFFPRSYDLRSSRELQAFLLDFAVTRAESVLRGNETSAGLLQACRLLGRLSHAQVCQSEALCAGSFRSSQDLVGFTHEDEWVLQPGGSPAAAAQAQALLARVASDTEEGLLASAVTLETRWWLEHLEKQEQRQFSLNGVHGFWMLKEPSLNCGRGVRVFSELLPLLQEAERVDWHVIVQKYMERPLLAAGRKCDLRLWVLVTSWNPAVIWVWPEPYLRLASRPFTWDNSQAEDPYVHLTNRAVQKRDGAAKGPLEEDEAHIWLLPSFLRWAQEELKDVPGGAMKRWKEYTWPKMLEAVRTCVLSCKEDVGAHPRGCFELFGFDFLLDCDMGPWLLEANSSPDLCEDAGPSLRRMTEAAMQQLLQLVLAMEQGVLVLPGATKCDAPVLGSGDWHLILQEEGARGSKELELRRAVRASRRPPSVSTKQRTQHREVLRATLGGCQPSVCARRPEPKETLQPRELVLAEEVQLLPDLRRSACRHTGF